MFALGYYYTWGKEEVCFLKHSFIEYNYSGVLVHFSSLEKERKQSPVRECANNKGALLLSYPAPQAHPIEDTKLLP